MTPTTGLPSNRVVTPGNQSLAELLSEVGNGVYVTSWLGGNADGTTGDFSLGLRGHMIENGEVGRPVGEMNVTGNLRDLFSRLEMIGNDPYPYSSTLSPSLVFSAVDFSGA
jgi:PmbA protein